MLTSRRSESEKDRDEFVFEVTPKLDVGHGRKPFTVDLRVLRDGRPATRAYPGLYGRPELAREVLPAFKEFFQREGVAKATAQFEIQRFLHLWQFLDSVFEQVRALGGEGLPESVRIHDVPGLIWKSFKDELAGRESGDAHSIYWITKRVLEKAAELQGSDDFYLPPNPFLQPKHSQRAGDDPYSERVIRAMVAAATHEHRAVEQRFRLGAELAAVGEDPREKRYPQPASGPRLTKQGAQSDWTKEDTLYFVRHVMHLEPISSSAFRQRFQFESSVLRWAPQLPSEHSRDKIASHIGDHLRWFVPSASDILPAFLITILRTGWNEATVLDMSRRNWFMDHPEAPEVAVVMYGRKGRAGGRKQQAYSLKQKKGHAYDIVRQVIEWTEPLQQQVLCRLDAVSSQIAVREAHGSGVAELEQERRTLLDLKDRVWLCLSQLPAGVTRLKSERWFMNAANGIFARHRIADRNGQPVRWSTRRSRDAWAMFVYESSGYNVIVTLIALGHKNLGALIDYLHRKAVVARNRKAVRTLQRNLISEIRLGRGVGPGVLRHLVKNGSITEEERVRLEAGKTRTRYGIHCANPRDPDPEVDPRHKPGELCATQDCLRGCSKAFTSADTLPYLAKTIVDLRQKQATCPLPQWETSDWKWDLEAAEFLFSQYAPDLQAKALRDAERSPSPDLIFVPST